MRRQRDTPDARALQQWLLQLATLVGAGLALQQALQVLVNTLPPGQQARWQPLLNALDQGRTLAAGLQAQALLPDRDLALIRMAEQTGRIDAALQQLAERHARRLALRQRLAQTLRYPLAVLAGALLVSGFLLLRVVPGFADLYHQFGAELPWLTRTILALSRWLQDAMSWLLPLMLVTGGLLAWAWRHRPEWRLRAGDVVWHLPVAGDLLRDLWFGLWHRTLADMLAAGLPYLDCLDEAARTVSGSPLRHHQASLRAAVDSGRHLSCGLRDCGDYPPLCHQLVAIGEESGRLAFMLGELAGQFERSLETRCDQLLRLLEPMLMAGLGVLVGTLVMALYLPLFQLGQVL